MSNAANQSVDSGCWFVEGGQVATVVCTTLLAAKGGFHCEYAGHGDSVTGGQLWFKFTMRADEAQRLRPPIACDEPRYTRKAA